MRLRKVQIDLVSSSVAKAISSSDTAKIATSEGDIAGRVAEIIRQNIDEERHMEEDALKLLEKHKRAIGGGLDEAKALQMIKRQLAKERDFVL